MKLFITFIVSFLSGSWTLNQITMKTINIQPLLLLFLIWYGCKQEDKEPCDAPVENKYTLSDYAKSKVPYLKAEFDTLSFASNKGDTLVFVRQPVTYGWYYTEIKAGPGCTQSRNYYENYGAKYICIKGSGSFEFRHGKMLYVNYSLNNTASKELYDVIELFFNGIHLIYSTNSLDDQKHYSYIGDTLVDGKMYKSSIYQYHEWSFSDYGKGLINQDYGLFQLHEKQKSNIWILFYPK